MINKRFNEKVAILGASGHIAKNLIFYMASKYNLVLFGRSSELLQQFLRENNLIHQVTCMNYGELHSEDYRVIINCTGIGDPQRLREEPLGIFQVTEEIDNLILNYLSVHKETLYINTSSGAAYCSDFINPSMPYTKTTLNVNCLETSDYYGICKLYSESKHRALSNLYIVDLRIFGFFSRFVNLNSTFLVTDLIKCINENREFVTNQVDIVRDYVHPQDLVNLIELIISKHQENATYDVYSSKPITKFEMIHHLQEHYGLKVNIINSESMFSVTGAKLNYYSCNDRAKEIGYLPNFTSSDTIFKEIAFLLCKSMGENNETD